MLFESRPVKSCPFAGGNRATRLEERQMRALFYERGIPGDISRCDITLEPGIVGKLSIHYIFRALFASATIMLSVNIV